MYATGVIHITYIYMYVYIYTNDYQYYEGSVWVCKVIQKDNMDRTKRQYTGIMKGDNLLSKITKENGMNMAPLVYRCFMMIYP